MIKSFVRFSSLALVGAAACGVGCQGSSSTPRQDHLELQLAACGSSPDQIRACKNASGILHVIDTAQSCGSHEELLCWNQVGPQGANSLITVTVLLAGDSLCPTGGSKLTAGVDVNNDGSLDGEPAASAYVCNGATGPQGPQGDPGQNGTPCSVTDHGDGTKTIACGDGTTVTVSDGVDGDSCSVTKQPDNTKLIVCGATSAVVSDGANGAIGPAGAQGDPGAPGTNGVSCWDLNGNGACELDPEDKDENGVCDAADCQGLNSLIRITPELAGDKCPNGGQQIETGLDSDRDGLLEDDEVLASATAYVCTPAGFSPTCTDGVKNGSETGVDCGGGVCVGCAVGAPCGLDSDCATAICDAGTCASEGFFPLVRCGWTSSPGDPFPAHTQVLSTPIIVRLPFLSPHPAIVIVAYDGTDGGGQGYAGTYGIVRILDGATCEQLAVVDDPANRLVGAASVAAGDLDGDGLPELVAHRVADTTSGPSQLVAFKWNATAGQFATWWVTTGSGYANASWFSPALHDLDDDGAPEVISQGEVFAGSTGVRLNPADSPLGLMSVPAIADLDHNGTAEMVLPWSVFEWAPSGLRWVAKRSATASVRGLAALADMGTFGSEPAADARATLDGVPEIVAINGTHVQVMTLEGRWILDKNTSTGVQVLPTVADFDGDGRAEFAINDGATITVYDLDCGSGGQAGCGGDQILWSAAIFDTSSRSANSTAFDFDGDGSAELLLADQCNFRVFTGTTGAVLFSVPNQSCTFAENPTVADIDSDDHAEIILAANKNCTIPCADTTSSGGVRVFADSRTRWQKARPIWNQSTYSITNVNDDGTIPSTSTWSPSWGPSGLNSYLGQR
jgi:hypothetical protein